MTELLGIIQFIIIVCILIYEFKSKSSAVFLWAMLFIMFGMMHLIASFHGDNEYSDIVLCRASFFVIGFCLIYFLTRYVIGSKTQNRMRGLINFNTLREQVSDEKFNELLFTVFFAGIIGLMMYPYIRYAGGILNTSWGDGRAFNATLQYANTGQVYRILYFAFSGLVVICILNQKKYLTIISCLLILFFVVLTRNRIDILPLLCSLAFIMVAKNEKINFKVLLLGIVAAVLAVYIIYGLRVFRHYGSISAFIEKFEIKDFINRVNTYIETDNGELGLRRDFYHFVKYNNNFKNFGKGHTYIRMLLVYIPTEWSLGLKPPDFAQSMGSAVGMIVGGSTHPTLFGDCYANLGAFGIILGFFWAIYVSIADQIVLLQKRKTTAVFVYMIYAVTFIIIGRGSVYNSFWYLSYGLPVILFMDYIINKKKHYKIVFNG